jgi:hypothetical protein
MVAALGSIIDVGDYQGLTPEQLSKRVDALLGSIPDPAGTYYKFPGAILGGRTA